MDPVTVSLPNLSFIYIALLADSKAYSSPPRDPAVGEGDSLRETKEGIGGIITAMNSLHAVEVDAVHLSASRLRDDPVTFIRPKRIRLDLDFQGLDIVRALVLTPGITQYVACPYHDVNLVHMILEIGAGLATRESFQCVWQGMNACFSSRKVRFLGQIQVGMIRLTVVSEPRRAET